MSGASYHFPTLKADLSALCSSGYSTDFGPSLVGKTYCFHWQEACDHASEFGMSLGDSLSFDLARGFTQHQHASPVLVWYSPAQKMLFLHVTGNHTSAYTDWMSKSAGYFESAQDYLRPSAVPFFYWDGQYPYRVYQVANEYRDQPYWIQDLGNMVATLVIADTRENFERIVNDQAKNVDYAPIKTSAEIVLRKGDARVMVNQAMIELINNPLEERKSP